jgi:hypothetical protein
MKTETKKSIFSREKLLAAGFHLAISVCVAIAVLLLVYFFWYPSVLADTQAIGSILFVVLAVDVILGPCLTFFVFKKGKKSLRFDLTCIALAQLLFLGFGVHTVFSARPAFLVFSTDRFEVVSTLDWTAENALNASKIAVPSLTSPKTVGAKLPADATERQVILDLALAGGADVAQMPKHYVAYADVMPQVKNRAKPLTQLRALNPKRTNEVDAIPTEFGLPADQLAFLPLHGKINDAVVIIERQSARILGMRNLKPWP